MRQLIFSRKGIINFLPILACLIITGLISCNSKTEETGTTSDTTTEGGRNNQTTTTSTTDAAPNSFYTLKLDSATLVELFKDTMIVGEGRHRARKIIVQVIDSNVNNKFGLIAYGVRENNRKTTGPWALTALSNPPTTFPGYTILGDQELTIIDIRNILILVGGGRIPVNQFKTLKFVPQRDGNRHLYYTVTKLGLGEASGSAPTNPSPPAPPCNPCD